MSNFKNKSLQVSIPEYKYMKFKVASIKNGVYTDADALRILIEKAIENPGLLEKTHE